MWANNRLERTAYSAAAQPQPSMVEKMNYRIKYGDTELLDSIEPLWQDLNSLHAEKSLHFKQDYRAFSFETRKQDLIEKSKRGSLRVSISSDEQNRIFGYCVSSIQDREGEIDSIFVREAQRRKGIGSELMEDCMNWFRDNHINRIKVGVAQGNEDTFQFYEKFGFYPRVTYLTTRNWLSDQ